MAKIICQISFDYFVLLLFGSNDKNGEILDILLEQVGSLPGFIIVRRNTTSRLTGNMPKYEKLHKTWIFTWAGDL